MISLENYIKSLKKFDYVFADLTDIPISDTPTGEIWNFIQTILEQSFKILRPNGIFLTHVRLKFNFTFIYNIFGTKSKICFNIFN